MPRYFFHLVEGGQHFHHEHGKELPGLVEAHTVRPASSTSALSLSRAGQRQTPGSPLRLRAARPC